MGPAAIPWAVVASMHHQRHAGLFHPPGTGPDGFKCHAIIDVEVEMAAGAQGARHSPCDQRQVALSRHMIERIEFAQDKVHRLREPEMPHVARHHAQRQAHTPGFFAGQPAHGG